MASTSGKSAGYPDFEIYPAIDRGSSSSEKAAKEDDVCWICTDGRSEEDPGDWIRPCKCSLVAHHSCLKEWLDSKKVLGDELVECPQCRTMYRLKITNRKLAQLRRFVRAIESTSMKPPWILVCVALPIAVGYSMVRAYMGASGTRLLLTGFVGVAGTSTTGRVFDTFSFARWNKAAWVLLPLVPVGMLVCDLGIKVAHTRRNILKLAPCYLLPWLPLAIYGHYRDGPRAQLFRIDASFPPGPVTTLAAIQILGGVMPLLRDVLYQSLFGCPAPTWLRIFLSRPLESLPTLFVAGFIETAFNPLNAWLYGLAASAIGRRWLPLGRFLGIEGPGLAPSIDQTWRVEGVRPEWWASAVGGMAYLAITDTCRLAGFLIVKYTRKGQRIREYADFSQQEKDADAARQATTANAQRGEPVPPPGQAPAPVQQGQDPPPQQMGFLARFFGM